MVQGLKTSSWATHEFPAVKETVSDLYANSSLSVRDVCAEKLNKPLLDVALAHSSDDNNMKEQHESSVHESDDEDRTWS
jgi:hypothetical protein